MNATTKRLQAHSAHALACHYGQEAQAQWDAYCRLCHSYAISGKPAKDVAGQRYVEAKDRADALRLASRSLHIQARSLAALEGSLCAR